MLWLGVGGVLNLKYEQQIFLFRLGREEAKRPSGIDSIPGFLQIAKPESSFPLSLSFPAQSKSVAMRTKCPSSSSQPIIVIESDLAGTEVRVVEHAKERKLELFGHPGVAMVCLGTPSLVRKKQWWLFPPECPHYWGLVYIVSKERCGRIYVQNCTYSERQAE